ncbi:MAG: hypothetical protein LRZ97_01525 [Candidatus Pacebacteria bacterium]|nr:hypothetical protein [Candidatus Paceibacterota bacterium]
MEKDWIADYEDSQLNFVTLPRKIRDDYSTGKITTAERNLLMWLRLNGDPYGRAHVSIKSLAEDTFSKTVDSSYIRKLMLSLKNNKYIYFKGRRGSRGMFQVSFPDWIRPDKTISTFESRSIHNTDTPQARIDTHQKEQESPSSSVKNHNLSTGVRHISSVTSELQKKSGHSLL